MYKVIVIDDEMLVRRGIDGDGLAGTELCRCGGSRQWD